MGRTSNREKIIIAERRAAASNDFERVKGGLLPAAYEEIVQDYLDASRDLYAEYARQILRTNALCIRDVVRCFVDDYSAFSDAGLLDAQLLDCFRLKYAERLTKEQTAERLNIDPMTVYRWINKVIPLFGEWLADNLPNEKIESAARKCATEGKESRLSKFTEYYSIWQQAKQAKRLTAYYKHIPV